MFEAHMQRFGGDQQGSVSGMNEQPPSQLLACLAENVLHLVVARVFQGFVWVAEVLCAKG